MTTVRPAGFATRATGLAIDGAVLAVCAVVLGAGAAIAAAVVGIDLGGDVLTVVLAGWAWLVLVVTYLAAFFSLTGQTPGMRALGIRLVDLHGRTPGRVRALARVGGMFLAALPAGAGYLLILVDDRRRGLQDRVAQTLVVYDGEAPAPPAGATAPAITLEPEAAATPALGLMRQVR